MKLTMVTEWYDNKCTVSSRLPDNTMRVQSCISQTQEWCFNLYGLIPTPVEILKHMIDFTIDELG